MLDEAIREARVTGATRVGQIGHAYDTSIDSSFTADDVLADNWIVVREPREWTACIFDLHGEGVCGHVHGSGRVCSDTHGWERVRVREVIE